MPIEGLKEECGLFEGAGVTLAPNAGGAYLCQWEPL